MPLRTEIWKVEYGDHVLDPEQIEEFVLDEFGFYTRFKILEVKEENNAR